jgi:hypothetical protein
MVRREPVTDRDAVCGRHLVPSRTLCAAIRGANVDTRRHERTGAVVATRMPLAVI